MCMLASVSVLFLSALVYEYMCMCLLIFYCVCMHVYAHACVSISVFVSVCGCVCVCLCFGLSECLGWPASLMAVHPARVWVQNPCFSSDSLWVKSPVKLSPVFFRLRWKHDDSAYSVHLKRRRAVWVPVLRQNTNLYTHVYRKSPAFSPCCATLWWS